MKTKLLLSAFFLSIGLFISAQDSLNIATLKLNKRQILIGDQFELILDINLFNTLNIKDINIKDSLDNRVEILQEFSIDTLNSSSKSLHLQKRYLLSCFDSAWIVFKPIQLYAFENNSDSLGVLLTTNTDSIFVNAPTIDEKAEIKDIKTIEDEPFQWKEIYPYLIGIAITLLFAITGYLIYRRWKKKLPILELFKTKPKPAHILAFEQLKILDDKKLWHTGQVKEYYTELSDIFRLYLENRFQIPALEQITDEIIESLNSLKIDYDLIALISEMLKLADSVKFAKFSPLPNENSKAWDVVFTFVDKTKLNTEDEARKEANI